MSSVKDWADRDGCQYCARGENTPAHPATMRVTLTNDACSGYRAIHINYPICDVAEKVLRAPASHWRIVDDIFGDSLLPQPPFLTVEVRV